MQEFDYERHDIKFKMSVELNTYDSNDTLAIILNCRYVKKSGQEVEERYDHVTSNLDDERLVGNHIAVDDGIWRQTLLDAICQNFGIELKKIGETKQNWIIYNIYEILNPQKLKEVSFTSDETGINNAIKYAELHA